MPFYLKQDLVMPTKVDRRKFLQRSTAAALGILGFPCVVPASALGKNGAVAPSNRIVIGSIGVGSMGTGDMRSLLGHKDVHIRAVCDVWGQNRIRAKEIVDRQYGDRGCDTYTDFRELINRNDIDAVQISTPDHWHVLIALEAARKGKDIFMQKAMGLSLAEDKALRQEVNRHGVVFQHGTQQRSDIRFRFACELVRNGRIGQLKSILVSSSSWGAGWPLQPAMPVPKDLDYDMWLGPAPWAPYTYDRCRSGMHGKGQGAWYRISDYSTGEIGTNWGIHHLDIAQWANDADDTGPVAVEGTAIFPEDGLADNVLFFEIKHMYANGVQLTHIEHFTCRKNSYYAAKMPVKDGRGILFEGTEGWVFVERGIIDAHPKSLLQSVIGPDEIHLSYSTDHFRNWLDCIRNREKTVCPVEVALRSDTLVHQALIALRLGRKLKWDPVKEEFINDAEANRLMTRSLRSPWHL
jgi:predicted dehydrogenase